MAVELWDRGPPIHDATGDGACAGVAMLYLEDGSHHPRPVAIWRRVTVEALEYGPSVVSPRLQGLGDRDLLVGVLPDIGEAQQRAFRPKRIGLMIAGLEVPHLHIHVVPIDGVHDLDFANAARSVEAGELEEAASEIRTELTSMGLPGVGG